MASQERIREVETFTTTLQEWATERRDVGAAASSARGRAMRESEDSDVDVALLTDNPSIYLEGKDWIPGLARSAELPRSGRWGVIEERRLLLPSARTQVGLRVNQVANER